MNETNENTVVENNEQAKKGRKMLKIEFPTNNAPFTFGDITNLNSQVSKATIRARMNKMVIEGKIRIGEAIQSGSVGRPMYRYFVNGVTNA